jgi:MFS family permease
VRFADTISQAARALRHRNFRLFTAGQSISLLGTWMQQVAVGWLVYRLTGSPLLLGLVGFVSQAPAFLLAPIAGAIVDRHDKHRIVIVTQIVMMVQALALATLILTGVVEIWQIIALMAVLGCASGFDIPARQAFLLEMVGVREDLPNAIALNSSMFNAARLIGPAVAGFVISAVGEGICILINGVSYIAVLAALYAMRLTPPASPAASGAVLARIVEGFDYAFRSVPIRSILVLVAIVSLVAVPFTVLLPIVATDVLRGDARTLGFLMSATGLGALAGALFLASRSTVRGLGRVIVFAAFLFGTALIAVAFSRTTWISMLCLAAAGFGMMAQMASSNTVLQTIVDDDKRGRVMSIYSMAFVGTAPLGALLAGALADRLGAPAALGAGGVLCVLAAAGFGSRLPVLREAVRPIYARLGILPEVARGIQAATHQTTSQTDDPRR